MTEAGIKIRIDDQEARQKVGEFEESVTHTMGRIARGSERRELHAAIAGIGEQFGEGGRLATGFLSVLTTIGPQAAIVGGAIGAIGLVLHAFKDSSKEAAETQKEFQKELKRVQEEAEKANESLGRTLTALALLREGFTLAGAAAARSAKEEVDLEERKLRTIERTLEAAEKRETLTRTGLPIREREAALTHQITGLEEAYRLQLERVAVAKAHFAETTAKLDEAAEAEDRISRQRNLDTVAHFTAVEQERLRNKHETQLKGIRDFLRSAHQERIAAEEQRDKEERGAHEKSLAFELRAGHERSILARRLFDERERMLIEQGEREEAREIEIGGRLDLIGNRMATSIGATIGQMTASIAAGEASVAQGIGRLLGSIVSQFGQVIMAIGAAAIAGGVLGTAVPLFGAILGGPQAIAAGIGLETAGGILVGLGSVLGGALSGGGGTGGSPAAAAAGASAGFGRPANAPRAFGPSPTEVPGTVVYNVSFGSTAVIGSKAEVGRAVASALDRVRRLGAPSSDLMPARGFA